MLLIIYFFQRNLETHCGRKCRRSSWRWSRRHHRLRWGILHKSERQRLKVVLILIFLVYRLLLCQPPNLDTQLRTSLLKLFLNFDRFLLESSFLLPIRIFDWIRFIRLVLSNRFLRTYWFLSNTNSPSLSHFSGVLSLSFGGVSITDVPSELVMVSKAFWTILAWILFPIAWPLVHCSLHQFICKRALNRI